MGTPEYVSPEILSEKNESSPSFVNFLSIPIAREVDPSFTDLGFGADRIIGHSVAFSIRSSLGILPFKLEQSISCFKRLSSSNTSFPKDFLR